MEALRDCKNGNKNDSINFPGPVTARAQGAKAGNRGGMLLDLMDLDELVVWRFNISNSSKSRASVPGSTARVRHGKLSAIANSKS